MQDESPKKKCRNHEWVREMRLYWLKELGESLVCKNCGNHGVLTPKGDDGKRRVVEIDPKKVPP